MRPASTPAGGPSAVHRAVDTELERVARRWQQLPLGRAVTAYPQVYAVVQALAAPGASPVSGRHTWNGA